MKRQYEILYLQLAKLAGNTVVATCGGEEKAMLLKNLGVDRVIDYRAEDIKTVCLFFPQFSFPFFLGGGFWSWKWIWLNFMWGSKLTKSADWFDYINF